MLILYVSVLLSNAVVSVVGQSTAQWAGEHVAGAADAVQTHDGQHQLPSQPQNLHRPSVRNTSTACTRISSEPLCICVFSCTECTFLCISLIAPCSVYCTYVSLCTAFSIHGCEVQHRLAFIVFFVNTTIRWTLIVTCVAVVSCRVLACREDHSVSPSPAQPKTKPFVSKLPSPKTYTSRLEMFEFCTACNNYVLYLTCLSVSYQRGRWFVFQCDEIPVSQQKPAGANNSGRREKVNTWLVARRLSR